MSEVVCPYCSKLFLKQNNLNAHLKNYCPVLKASIAMASLNVTERAGRTSERDDKPPSRKSSRSRERGVLIEEDEDYGVEESEAQQFFNATYPRLLKAADPVKVFDGADEEVQTLLTEKYFKERTNFLREKAAFEVKEQEFQKLDTVFQQILMRTQVTSTTSASTSNTAGGILGFFNTQTFNTTTSANP